MATSPRLPATPKQLPLDLGIEVEKDVNGIEMGVLENGMAYLTQRGLSAICGAARSTIQEITKELEKTISALIPSAADRFIFQNISGKPVTTNRRSTWRYSIRVPPIMPIPKSYAWLSLNSSPSRRKGQMTRPS
ncbi:hypothetical protein [Mesorhizobium sp. B3-2-1]|uniref:hypothetical protein n=1 Tax=Mesorhizobium sp. B3-2-1 TaxID=2589891 RepID=UPI001127A4DD|nr:hypothetical protein [Mesorhizobium sp. B3-2-1]